jgi:hypothetical protein
LIPRTLPDYVERGGRQVWRPPYTARRARLFGFVVTADRTAIDALLQRDLVQPSAGAVEYRCAHENVIVTFAHIECLTSADSRDRARGYVSERELAVWCLASDPRAPGRLVWYLPYVFTDSGQATAAGREVYGYPKQLGLFDADYPQALAEGGVTTVSAYAIHPYAIDQPARARPMIVVDRHPATEPAVQGTTAARDNAFERIASRRADAEPPASAVITRVTDPPPRTRGLHPLAGLRSRTLSDHPNDLIIKLAVNPTLVFLKQFPDVSAPTKACYQAIVEAPLVIDPIGASYQALDPALFRMTIEDWASHPIPSELGLPNATPIEPVSAFEATLGFDVLLGHEVWRAAI